MFGKKTTIGDVTEKRDDEPVAASTALSQQVPDKGHVFSKHESEIIQDPFSVFKPEVFYSDTKLQTQDYLSAKKALTDELLERTDFGSLYRLSDEVKRERIREACDQIIASSIDIPLTAAQISLLKDQAINDLLGFGPIETLMADGDVSDIMINGPQRVFIEKAGKILLTDVTFTSERHLISVIQKIVSIVGRRVDESSPMVDARMPDGSRFNAIIPPLALDGSLVSIRKFKKQKMPLRKYVEIGSMSEAMHQYLSICGQIRLNIIISGGTGSGKTTLLNALSGCIEHRERIVTIEDAAELQLQQPHVLRMETRPPNMEGAGEISQRQLVKNALRMRPDRIILGEIRGDEVIDMLSAMNTGHDGSMGTVHANSPRDAMSRIENLIGMSGVQLSTISMRQQIANAVHLVIQISRQRDGRRRITQINEITGIDGDMIVMQTMFGFRPGPMGADGVLTGEFYCTGAKSHFLSQAAYYSKESELLAALAPTSPGAG